MPLDLIKCFGINGTGFLTAPQEALLFPQAEGQHPVLPRGEMTSPCMKEKPVESANYHSVQICMFPYNTKWLFT